MSQKKKKEITCGPTAFYELTMNLAFIHLADGLARAFLVFILNQGYLFKDLDGSDWAKSIEFGAKDNCKEGEW